MFFMTVIFKIISYSVSKLFGYRFFDLKKVKNELSTYYYVQNLKIWQRFFQFLSNFFHSNFQLFNNKCVTEAKKQKKKSLFIWRKLHMFFLPPQKTAKNCSFLNVIFSNSFLFLFLFGFLLNINANNIIINDINLNLYQKADSLFYKGNYDQSIQYFEQYLKAKPKLKVEQKKYIYLLISQSYFYTGNFGQAIKTANTIIEDINSQKLSLDYNSYLLLSIVSNSYSKIGNYDKAISILSEIELNFNFNSSQFLNLKTFFYNDKGLVYYRKGDYENGRIYFEKALQSARKDDVSNKSTILLNLGNIYLKTNNFVKAKVYYQQRIDLIKDVMPEQIANTLNSYAIACKMSGDLKKAEKFYKAAIENRLKYLPQSSNLGFDYLNLGELYAAKNQNSLAFSYYKRAELIFQNNFGSKNNNLSATYIAYAELYEKKNQIKQALDYYQQALIAVSPDFNSMEIACNPQIADVFSKLYMLKALKGKAESILKKDNVGKNELELSLKTYQLAIQLIDNISKSYINDESKLFLSDNEKNTYVAAMQVAEKLYIATRKPEYVNIAFGFAEKSKSSVLLSNIRANEAIRYGKIPSFVQSIDQNMKNNISFYEQSLYYESIKKNKDFKKESEYKNKVFELKSNQEKFYSFLDKNYSEYYNLKYKNPVTDIKTLQNKINAKDAIVEYVLTDEKLFTFLVTKDYFTVNSCDIDKNFFDQINIVKNYSSLNSFGNSSLTEFQNYTNASYQLYSKLFKPYEKIISWNHLIVIPDKELNLISFETLLNKAVDCKSVAYNNLPYLILEHPVSYSYSASLLMNDTKTSGLSSSNNLLAMAPDYKDNQNSNNVITRISERNKLAPLPYAKDEIKGISEIYNGQQLTDYNATKTNFCKKVNDFDILHLAMHAEINDENPMFSRLVFSESKSGKNEGMLNTSDIYNMNIHSKLIVLSACNTGNGKLRNGEGVMSLSRAFLYAGCPSMVMTLWSVEDKAGSELMISFYSYLSKGFSKDKAMQLAKIDYIKNSPASKTHPYYWAAYVPIGDQSPVNQMPKDYSSLAYFALIAGIGLGITPFFTNRKLKRRINNLFRLRSKVFDC